jgi:uncharacterized membrane protein YfcA
MFGIGDLLLIAAVVFAAAFLQTISGFGFALFVVPLFGLVIDVKTGVVISTLSGAVASTFHTVKDRNDIDRPLARRLIGSSLVGMPCGLLILVSVPSELLQVLVGLLVLLAALVLVRGVTLPAESRRVDRIAGFVSGVLATATSTNGPPLVVTLQAKQLPVAVFRPTVNSVFVVGAAVSIALYATAGRIGWQETGAALLALPGLMLGIALGRHSRQKVTARGFRALVIVLLVLTGATSVLAGIA